ncbi:isochorismatase family protein [Streptomyces prunicolor]|uniref:isochorismatase family protein n=1 Tax=Streptomyces prunicolor TaxID=67348 RepID=UPI0037113FD2
MPIPPTEPYPMPGPDELPANVAGWTPDPRRAALLVHDMQRYFLASYAPAGSPLVPLMANTAELKRRCAALGMPVIFSAQPGDQSPAERALLRDFWGPGMSGSVQDTGFTDELIPSAEDAVITKWRYSAFVHTGLADLMEKFGRDQLLVCGVYTAIGCLATACDAFMRDIQPFLVADATADFSAGSHRDALGWAARHCAVVGTTASFLRQLET